MRKKTVFLQTYLFVQKPNVLNRGTVSHVSNVKNFFFAQPVYKYRHYERNDYHQNHYERFRILDTTDCKKHVIRHPHGT